MSILESMSEEELKREAKVLQLEHLKGRNQLQSEMSSIALEKARASLRKDLALAETQEAVAHTTKINAAQQQRQEDAYLAGDVYYKLYYFSDPIMDKTVENCMARLAYWTRREPGCTIDIVFASDGGEVIAGFALFDFITQLRNTGHVINTSVLGGAFSMAAVLLQSGTHRSMGSESWLMFHQGSIGTQGTTGQVQDAAEWTKRMAGRMVDILARRAVASAAEAPIGREELARRIIEQRSDWWVSSEDALKWGLVDEVK